MGVNSVTLAGRLTRDPAVQYTASGTCAVQFGIAVDERRRAQDGSWQDVPMFFDCSIYGAHAESLSRILCKGMPVTVQGRLRWSSWEKDGERRSRVDVVVDEVALPPRREQAQQAVQDAQQPVQQAVQAQYGQGGQYAAQYGRQAQQPQYGQGQYVEARYGVRQ